MNTVGRHLVLLMAISCLLVGVHAHAAPIAANSRVLFLGREATTHTAEFAALYGADSSVTNLNLSVDSFDSTHVWDDLFSGRTASSDSNALLSKLDQGFKATSSPTHRPTYLLWTRIRTSPHPTFVCWWNRLYLVKTRRTTRR